MAQGIVRILFSTAMFLLASLAMFQPSASYAQNTYLGPVGPSSKGRLIKVQIEIYDEPELGGNKVLSVSFDGRQIPLKPADISGFRGGAGLEAPPGTYDLVWEVSLGTGDTWPRTAKRQQKVRISLQDSWVQISIQGQQAVVS